MDITLLVTDRNLKPVADPIDEWTELECEPRFNEPGFGSFTAPARPQLLDAIAPGNRITVIRDGAYFLGGPIEKPGNYKWSAGDENPEPGTLTVDFTDDLMLVCGRITYPDPGLVSTDPLQPDRNVYTATNAEVIMRTLVNLNAAAFALTPRKVTALALGALAGVGTTINFSTRFQPLGDELRSVAIQGGGLGFRTVQGTSAGVPAILFEVYDPADLTGTVRFSRGLGNLRSFEYDPTAPSATVAIVGGGGEGDARIIRARQDTTASAAWWRLEVFVDQRQTSDNTELDQAGSEALAEGAETAALSVVAVDTPKQRFGTHYNLGDKVSVELHPGLEIADVVRAANLTAKPDEGEVVTVLVGNVPASTNPEWIRATRNIARRVGRLEAI